MFTLVYHFYVPGSAGHLLFVAIMLIKPFDSKAICIVFRHRPHKKPRTAIKSELSGHVHCGVTPLWRTLTRRVYAQWGAMKHQGYGEVVELPKVNDFMGLRKRKKARGVKENSPKRMRGKGSARNFLRKKESWRKRGM